MSRPSGFLIRVALVAAAACALPSPAHAQSSADTVYYDFQVDRQAAVVAAPPPRYPDMLRSAGVEGSVLAQFVVRADSTADMGTLKVLRSEHDLFTQSVRVQLPLYRFRPAMKNGRLVKQLVQMPFVFSLARLPGGGSEARIGMSESRAFEGMTVRPSDANAATLAAFHLDLPLPEGPGECVVTPSRDGGRIVALVFPSLADRRVLASVWLDSLGKYVRYQDIRRTVPMFTGPFRTREAVDSAVRASDDTRNSALSLEYASGRVMLMNRGGGKSTEAISVPLAAVAHDPRFGAPADRARMVVDRCGTTPPRARP